MRRPKRFGWGKNPSGGGAHHDAVELEARGGLPIRGKWGFRKQGAEKNQNAEEK